MSVIFPPVLDPATGGVRTMETEGSTVSEVLASLTVAMPGVVHHLLDETGALRPHVLCFADGTGTRDLTTDVTETLRFLTAVSGG